MRPRPAGADPAPAAEAFALARRLLALEEGALRVRAAARALAATPPQRAAAVVAALVRAGPPEARAAAASVARALGEPGAELSYDWIAEVYAAAAAAGDEEVTALLVAPPPVRAFREPRDRSLAPGAGGERDEAAPEGPAPGPRPGPAGAPLTLGHRKALARSRHDPDLLARLAAEGEPDVVRELLRNPHLTEELVVRIAARRPCRPATLRCVVESRRWRTRTSVALAVVRNPYAEPALALELLPPLGAAELREIGRDGTLHPLVRAVAARLAVRRAP